ncbi:MAG: PorT family protein [Flavobacteriaceae bacterium]|nr:PorT family protein [Flavobacteriaceae bacterium]
MKKYFFFVLFFFFVYNLQSQILIALLLGDKLNTGKIEFGLDGGINFASIASLENKDYIRAFNLGFYFDIKLKDHFLLNTGVLVKSTLGSGDLSASDLLFLGATVNEPAGGQYSQKLNSFVVPIMAKYVFDNNMHIELGPQVGWTYNGWIEYNYDIDGISGKLKENNRDDLNWFEMGVTAGVGYRLLKGLGWTLGVRYYYGFTNVYKGKSGTTNDALYLKVNIPFGASEDKKQAITNMKTQLKTKKEEKKAARKAPKNKN